MLFLEFWIIKCLQDHPKNVTKAVWFWGSRSMFLLFSQEIFDIFQNELGGVNLVEAPRREVMVSPEDWTCSGLNLNFLCLGPKKIICDQVHCVELALTESWLFSRQLSDGFLSAFSHQPKISRFQNFSISLKFFFAWNVLKHKVKPKNSRNSTFFKKTKIPPYFEKTLVKISSLETSWFSADGWKPIKSRLKADG